MTTLQGQLHTEGASTAFAPTASFAVVPTSVRVSALPSLTATAHPATCGTLRGGRGLASLWLGQVQLGQPMQPVVAGEAEESYLRQSINPIERSQYSQNNQNNMNIAPVTRQQREAGPQ